MPRICSDRYSKAFGPHRGDTFGRSCAALPLPQRSGAAARSAWSKRYGAAGSFCAAGTGSGAFWLHVPAGRPAAFVPRDSGSHGRHLRMGSKNSAGTAKETEREIFRLGFRVRNDPSPLLEVPFCLKKDFFRNCSPCRRAWAEVFCFGNIPRMFTPFTLRIGMNWPMPTRPKHLRNWKRWPGKSFELYSALSSFGSSTFSRIATNAAGTMPDSPQISCKACGACARMPLLAPMP